jgi:hypothetical protein
MEAKDWEFSMRDYETGVTYFAQHKSTRRDSGEEILRSDLTKAEAMALLSLIGNPVDSFIGVGVCHFVKIGVHVGK